MEQLTAAYGRKPEHNLKPHEVKSLLEAVGRSGLIECPYRVRLVQSTEYHGQCTTDFDDEGAAYGHDIEITALNDSLLAHELAHAVANELLLYEELKDLNPHGSVFCECLTRVTEIFEDEGR